MVKKTLLIVDDEKAYARSIAFALKKEFEVSTASSYAEALQIIEKKDIEAAILDVRLDENDDNNKDGLKVLEWIKHQNLDIFSFVMTSYKDMGHKEEAMKLGAVHFFEKPIDILEMRRILNEKIA